MERLTVVTQMKRGKNALALMEDSEKRYAYLRVSFSSQQMLKHFLTELYYALERMTKYRHINVLAIVSILVLFDK